MNEMRQSVTSRRQSDIRPHTTIITAVLVISTTYLVLYQLPFRVKREESMMMPYLSSALDYYWLTAGLIDQRELSSMQKVPMHLQRRGHYMVYVHYRVCQLSTFLTLHSSPEAVIL